MKMRINKGIVGAIIEICRVVDMENDSCGCKDEAKREMKLYLDSWAMKPLTQVLKAIRGDKDANEFLKEYYSKHYKETTNHVLEGYFDATRSVYLDGKELFPEESQKYRNHSPDGFNWGYGGSGPAQLALAVVMKVTGKPDNYQDFKTNVILKIPQGKDFKIEFEL